MAFFAPEERRLAEGIHGLVYGNPFLPSRREWEKRVLGDAWAAEGDDGDPLPDAEGMHPNLALACGRVEAALEGIRPRLKAGPGPAPDEEPLLHALVFFHLYHRRREGFGLLVREAVEGRPRPGPVALFQDLLADAAETLGALPGRPFTTGQAAHLFACLFQVRRAFHLVSACVVGRSRPA